MPDSDVRLRYSYVFHRSAIVMPKKSVILLPVNLLVDNSLFIHQGKTERVLFGTGSRLAFLCEYRWQGANPGC